MVSIFIEDLNTVFERLNDLFLLSKAWIRELIQFVTRCFMCSILYQINDF